MKIRQKIILINLLSFVLISLLGFFNIINLNTILAKLRFVEISDDLNTTFLEMRIAEKNYFLYNDSKALIEIKNQIQKIKESVEPVKNDIINAVGETRFIEFFSYLKDYEDNIEAVQTAPKERADNLYIMEGKIRISGRNLYTFFKSMTVTERKQVNKILYNARATTIGAFAGIIFLALIVVNWVSKQMVSSIREVEKIAKSISEGKFNTISAKSSKDEIGSVIEAMNKMVEELRNREEQLVQSKKLESIGILTSGVAHELTNPLNNISMIAQNYLELYDRLSRENRIELMKKVEGEAERIEKIVRSLLDFSRPKEPDLKEADINDVVRDALRLTQNTLDVSNIEVKLDLEQGIPHILADEPQIQQVLVNLIVNAVQAMPPGGELSIETRLDDSKDFVEINVKDTGKGIAPEFLPHIFDPFFSTKGVGGTGLGLSVSYGIIKSHKGNIKVESTVGIGTTFTIEMPIYKK